MALKIIFSVVLMAADIEIHSLNLSRFLKQHKIVQKLTNRNFHFRLPTALKPFSSPNIRCSTNIIISFILGLDFDFSIPPL